MQRRYIWVSLYIFLLTSTVLMKVKGLPRSAERLLDAPNHIGRRIRRSAVDFHRLIRCYQPTVNVLGSYGNYGCFCGFSGGGYPIDETDKCCQIHDHCYAEAGEVEMTWWENVVSKLGHILPNYNFKFENGTVVCEADSSYRHKLCECDSVAAACFHRASATYHPQLHEIDSSKYCVANASYDDLKLDEYENRYAPLPTTPAKTATILVTPSKASADSKHKDEIKQKSTIEATAQSSNEVSSQNITEETQTEDNNLPKSNISSTVQVNKQMTSQNVIKTNQKTPKPTDISTPRTTSPTLLKINSTHGDVTSTLPRNQTVSPTQEKLAYHQINETRTRLTTQATAKSTESNKVSEQNEVIVVPKIVHPGQKTLNRTRITEDAFDVGNESNKTTANRRQKSHTHENKPTKDRNNKDQNLDIETELEISHEQIPNELSANSDLTNSSSNAEPRILRVHSHVRNSLARRNTDHSSANSIRVSLWIIIVQTCVVFMLHSFDFFDIFNL